MLALTLAAMMALAVFTSAALAELTVNEAFEYDSPGMTLEGKTVGPTHCKGKYQVNPKRFPATENETILGQMGPAGGREVAVCKSTNRQPISGNVLPGETFWQLDPNSSYWVSEWFKSFNPGQSCFVISLPRDRVKAKMSLSGKSYRVVAYLEYDRECHPRG
ncbi:MAG TPA: hypothetical protein VGH09_06035 [Solirubrobacteraceae bacterium]